jgi:hypothetical protein
MYNAGTVKVFANLLLVHVVVYLGLVAGAGLSGWQGLGQSLAAYPVHLWETLAETVAGGGLWRFQEGLLLTFGYLGLALVLAWLALPLFRRLPAPLLWTLAGLPSFLLLVLGVMSAFYLASVFRFWTPVEPGQPWLVAVLVLSLMLPYTARGALYLKLRQAELQGADFVRTARSVGMPESLVQRRTVRVALPEGVRLLSGEVFTLAVGVALVEGLLWLPGLGRAVFEALGGALAAAAAPGPAQELPSAAAASQAVLLLLLLAGLFAWAFAALAHRLDPLRR